MSEFSSLQSSLNQPKDVEGSIIFSIRNDGAVNRVWIVTESGYDKGIYENFYTGDVKVYPSNRVEDGKEKQGCADFVMKIVHNVRKESGKARVIGIIDKDYRTFRPRWNKFVKPEYVVMTDARDIEMQMLMAPSVLKKLKVYNPDYEKAIEDSIIPAQYAGYLRIWHERHYKPIFGVRNAHINNLRMSSLCDDTVRPVCLRKDWKKILVDNYNNIQYQSLNITIEELERYKSFRCLGAQKYYNVCRGHDFTALMGAFLKGKSNSDNINAKLAEGYSAEDYYNTLMHKEIMGYITQWHASVGVKS